jgi:hypothetical protein
LNELSQRLRKEASQNASIRGDRIKNIAGGIAEAAAVAYKALQPSEELQKAFEAANKLASIFDKGLRPQPFLKELQRNAEIVRRFNECPFAKIYEGLCRRPERR